MEKIKWSEKATNEQVLEHIGEKRTLLNNNLYDAIEGQMTEVKGVGRKTQLDDLRNRKYWELKKEAED
jgi:hypothetical protein